MMIHSVNGTGTQMVQMGINQAEDSYSRSIQSQIADAQKQMQELSANKDMSAEDKMKKRQEIQKQINDLNMQLRQHQMEQRRAAMDGSKRQQARGSSMDDMPGGTNSTKTGEEGTGFSQAGMAAMISAGSSIKQAKAQGTVATKMNGRAKVLESEIKLDQVRGGDTRKKEEELAQVQQRAQAAESSQIATLAEAGRAMEEAAKAEGKEKTADNRDDKDNKGAKSTGAEKKDFSQNVAGAAAQGEDVSVSESDNTQSHDAVSDSAAVQSTKHPSLLYRPVDIRL